MYTNTYDVQFLYHHNIQDVPLASDPLSSCSPWMWLWPTRVARWLATCEGVTPVPMEAAASPFLVIKEFNKIAKPLICADCKRDTFISKLNIVPLAVDDRRMASGCGWSEEGNEATGTGWIPSAWRAGKELTGTCTGIAAAAGVDGVVEVDGEYPDAGDNVVGWYGCAYVYGYPR